MVFKLLFGHKRNLHSISIIKNVKRNLCNAISAEAVSSNYNYLLILDFEATCENTKFYKKPPFQEIIEFPCLKINLKNFREEGRFHQYVKPVLQPTLSHFCVQLTGILQEVVDQSKTFPEVYDDFENWRTQEGLTDENSLYITSGDWDLGHMIPEQCSISNLEVPSHMNKWTDIKKLFGYNNEEFFYSFSDIMKYYNLEFEGRPHSGIDDCLNMLQVVKKMGESGIEFKPTTRIHNNKVETIESQLKEEVNQNIHGPSKITSKFYKKRR